MGGSHAPRDKDWPDPATGGGGSVRGVRFGTGAASEFAGGPRPAWATAERKPGFGRPDEKDRTNPNRPGRERSRVVRGRPQGRGTAVEKIWPVRWYGEGVSTLNGFRY